jgi:hypothetical protein
MGTAAIIVGVDDYAQQPLTSAVTDAHAVRDELLALKLVKPAEVTLLTSPAKNGSLPANSANIDAALQNVYDNGSSLDRLYFFFAGHGLLAPVDAARGKFHTAVLPADVADLRSGARLMLDVDDLCQRLVLAGPREQFLFVDACRDLAFGENPGNVPPLSWPASPNASGSANAQSILYAVSPLGKARGTVGGMGVMTGHVIEALRGTGRALDWSDEDESYVVTAASVAAYVRQRILENVRREPLWQQLIMLPELRPSGPPQPPIRRVLQPPKRRLVLTFDPEEAAAATTVKLSQRGNVLERPSWPPHKHREVVDVAPQLYRFLISSQLGEGIAEPDRIDARELDSATIRIGGSGPAIEPEPGPGIASVVRHVAITPGVQQPGVAVIDAVAEEPETVIEMAGLDPPYRSMSATGRAEESVPPGSYRVRFRLGSEVFSEVEVDLAEGERKLVRPTIAASPLLHEAIGQPADAERVVVSETIGPMQAAVLPTMLAIVAIKPFDETNELFGQFDGLVQPRTAADYGDRPFSVVVAVEGSSWPVPIAEITASLGCELLGEKVPLAPVVPGNAGWGRVLQGIAAASRTSLPLRISSPFVGSVELAAGSLPGRVTAVQLIIRPDGVLQVAQHILRIPGRAYDERVPHVPYGSMLRGLALGQKLYESGELIERVFATNAELLREVLYAEWSDPVLGCMAYYAWSDAAAAGAPAAQEPWPRQETANNLLRYFSELPDARVAGATAFPERRAALIDELLDEDAVPLLARSCWLLAEAARERGRDDASVVHWAERLTGNSSWAVRWEPSSAAWREEASRWT